MIVSRQNQRIKSIRRFRRCKGDEAVLEGPHLVNEARKAGIELEYVLATEEFLETSSGQAISSSRELSVSTVEPRLLADLCDSDSPRGILAVASLPRGRLDSIPRETDAIYVFVDGIQDPGNLGALARVAEGFGVVSLCLSPGSTHPNHPRALRASAGSLLRIPVSIAVEADDLDRHLRPVSPSWIALAPRGGVPVFETDLTGTWILAVGAEGPGLSRRISERADILLTIPLSPDVESFNSTVATAIALYELRGRGNR